MENEPISAFAFEIGRDIEALINRKISRTLSQNERLLAKILEFYAKIREMNSDELYRIEETYKEHFQICTLTKGNI